MKTTVRRAINDRGGNDVSASEAEVGEERTEKRKRAKRKENVTTKNVEIGYYAKRMKRRGKDRCAWLKD